MEYEEEFYAEENNEEFYNDESVSDLLENDEINGAEEGFMIGYMGA